MPRTGTELSSVTGKSRVLRESRSGPVGDYSSEDATSFIFVDLKLLWTHIFISAKSSEIAKVKPMNDLNSNE